MCTKGFLLFRNLFACRETKRMRIELGSHSGNHYKWYLHGCFYFLYKKKYHVRKNRPSNVKITTVFDLQNKMPQTAMVVVELNTHALQTANPISKRAIQNVQKGR